MRGRGDRLSPLLPRRCPAVSTVGDKAGWSVADGVIHLDAAKAKFSLFSEKTHSRNVIIRFEYRASLAADSGVFIHGSQFQVRDYPNSLPDTKRFAPYAKRPGEWNAMEFDITDGVAVVKLNDQVIAERWNIGNDLQKGFGLQKEKGDFDFRYIRVMEKQ